MKVNTDEMRIHSKAISSLAAEYQAKITKLYNIFVNLHETKEWTGGRANDYVKLVLLDKNEMMSVGDGIKSFAKTIDACANKSDVTITKAKRGED